MNLFNKVIMTVLFLTSFSAVAENDKGIVEKTKETTSEAYQDTKKVVKKTANKVSDKTCEMINGKMECAVKKVKHSVENGVGEVKDKVDDVKKK